MHTGRSLALLLESRSALKVNKYMRTPSKFSSVHIEQFFYVVYISNQMQSTLHSFRCDVSAMALTLTPW